MISAIWSEATFVRSVRLAMVAAFPFPSPQGSQVFVREMCEQLGAHHDVDLVTYGQRGEQRPAPTLYRHDTIRRLPGDDAVRSGPSLVKPVLDGLMIRRLVQLAKTRHYEVLHCHNYEAAMIGIAAGRIARIPVVYHSHNLMGDELSTYFDRPMAKAAAERLGHFLDRSVPRRADLAVALCDYSAGILAAAGVSRERLRVIPPAIADFGEALPVDKARSRFDIKSDDFVVAYAGNLDAYQDLELLLGALARLRRKGANVELLVAASRSDRRFAGQVAAAGVADWVRIENLARFDDVKAFLSAADVYVLPRSFGSGYPIKLLNYMCLGRSVASGGCGGKILRDGVDGLVYDDTAEGLARALVQLQANPELRRTLGTAARERFVNSFTWNSVLPNIESAYEAVLSAQV